MRRGVIIQLENICKFGILTTNLRNHRPKKEEKDKNKTNMENNTPQ